MKYKDNNNLIGEQFKDWIVIDKAEPRLIGSGKNKPKVLLRYWKCECHCGYCNNTIRDVNEQNLLSGGSKGCGIKSKIENGKNNKKQNKYEYIEDIDCYKVVCPNGCFIIDSCSMPLIKDYYWRLHADKVNQYGRAYKETDSSGKHIYIFVHNLIMNNMSKEFVVDHIDGDTLDNKKSNLRICSQLKNMKNLRLSKTNTSGHKGVSYSDIESKWKAYISVDGKRIHLGTFINYDDAVAIREKAENKYFEEYNREVKVND